MGVAILRSKGAESWWRRTRRRLLVCLQTLTIKMHKTLDRLVYLSIIHSMTKRSNIQAFQANDNLMIGLMVDCAIDNAGFDGLNNQIDNPDVVSDEMIDEIHYHLESIIDGQMISKATDADYMYAAQLLK